MERLLARLEVPLTFNFTGFSFCGRYDGATEAEETLLLPDEQDQDLAKEPPENQESRRDLRQLRKVFIYTELMEEGNFPLPPHPAVWAYQSSNRKSLPVISPPPPMLL